MAIKVSEISCHCGLQILKSKGLEYMCEISSSVIVDLMLCVFYHLFSYTPRKTILPVVFFLMFLFFCPAYRFMSEHSQRGKSSELVSDATAFVSLS